MSLKREIEVFDHVGISAETGETDVWDRVVFPEVIRGREVDLILKLADRLNPESILDYGCGAGWVSRVLASNGYTVAGIDSSDSLVRSAAQISPENARFSVGDCMNLPFGDGSFDLVISVAILHHLNPERGLAECYRVLSPGGSLLLLEPNKYNPLAAIARKVLPVDTQTPDEVPFAPGKLRMIFDERNWQINRFGYLFPYSFGFSQLLRKTRMDKKIFKPICTPLKLSEVLVEKIPLVNRLCWVIAVEARKISK